MLSLLRSHARRGTLAVLTLLVAGCGGSGSPGTPALEPLAKTPTFAVVSTDYISTAIAMLDETGAALNDDWYDSGTSAPSLVAPLSGDVALPTAQGAAGTFTLLDRLGTDVVTRFALPGGELIAQQRTQGVAMNTTFSSNPVDYVYVGAHSAWVVRRGYNTDASELPQNLGNDVIEMDPDTGDFTGARVDLSIHDEDLGAGIVAKAQPAAAAWAGPRLVVGLDRAHYDYNLGTSWASGGVAVVDLSTQTSTLFAPAGAVVNCSGVTPIPAETDRIIVTCAGDFTTATTVGFFLVAVDGAGAANVEQYWLGGVDPMAATPNYATIALDATHLLAVEFGVYADPPNPDTLYLLDLGTGEQTEVLSEVGIGQGAYDPSSGLLVVPTSGRGLVRMQVAGDFSVTDMGADVTLAPGLGLPPVQVSLL